MIRSIDKRKVARVNSARGTVSSDPFLNAIRTLDLRGQVLLLNLLAHFQDPRDYPQRYFVSGVAAR
jgi:hypothetical protein